MSLEENAMHCTEGSSTEYAKDSSLRILFMGTPDFAVPILLSLCDSPHEVVGVVTNPDREAGRGKLLTPPPVKVAALKYGIPVLQPEKIRRNDDFFNELKRLKPDCAVVVAYGQILPKRMLNLPLHGCLNVHASLLPKYRGASPIQAAIIHGETESGITIMQMEQGLDTGPMLKTASIPIGEKMNAQELHDQLSTLGGQMIVSVVEDWCAGKITPIKQDNEKSSYASMLSKEDGMIHWEEDAIVIHNLIRGVYPWPGAYTLWMEEWDKSDGVGEGNGEQKLLKKRTPIQIKIHKAQPFLNLDAMDLNEGFMDSLPGALYAPDRDTLLVKCGNGILQILELQPAGKRSMNVRDFLNGFQQKGKFIKAS